MITYTLTILERENGMDIIPRIEPQEPTDNEINVANWVTQVLRTNVIETGGGERQLTPEKAKIQAQGQG